MNLCKQARNEKSRDGSLARRNNPARGSAGNNKTREEEEPGCPNLIGERASGGGSSQVCPMENQVRPAEPAPAPASPLTGFAPRGCVYSAHLAWPHSSKENNNTHTHSVYVGRERGKRARDDETRSSASARLSSSSSRSSASSSAFDAEADHPSVRLPVCRFCFWSRRDAGHLLVPRAAFSPRFCSQTSAVKMRRFDYIGEYFFSRSRTGNINQLYYKSLLL